MHSVDDSRELVFQVLENLGIIPGEDMTVEAALTKLTFVLGMPDLTFQQRVMVSVWSSTVLQINKKLKIIWTVLFLFEVSQNEMRLPKLVETFESFFYNCKPQYIYREIDGVRVIQTQILVGFAIIFISFIFYTILETF